MNKVLVAVMVSGLVGLLLACGGAGQAKKQKKAPQAEPGRSEALPAPENRNRASGPVGSSERPEEAPEREEQAKEPQADELDRYRKASPVLIDEFLRVWQTNQLQAEARFKGKLVALIGNVKEVRKSGKGPVVYLRHGGMGLRSVSCHFKKGTDEDRLAALVENETVSIAGVVHKDRFGVYLKDCRFLKSARDD